MPITFYNADIKFVLRDKAALKKFITQQVTSSHHCLGTLSFIFCSDEYLLNINRQFLNHDYYTDIITFPLSEVENLLEAEIYISIDRVKENAEKYTAKKDSAHQPLPTFKNTYTTELQRVMFHGVLHLLGYKDKSKLQKEQMRKMEDLWLKRFKKYLAAQ
jgi:rRNA maturation RNase YbeY